MLLSLYLAVLDDQSKEEQFIDVYNIYKRLVYHTAYKIMGDSYLAEDVLQEVFLYVAKNFSKIHRENCHELAAYLVSCSRSRAYDSVIKAFKSSEGVDRTSMEWDVVLFSGIFRCHLYGNAVRFFAGYRSLHCMESIKWKCQRSRISQSSADCPMQKSESFH